MDQITTRFASFAVFLATALALWILLTGIPAFDPDARRQGQTGDWAVQDRQAHYDAGKYLYHMGFAFLNEPGLVFDEGLEELVLTDLDDFVDWTVKAEALLIESLDLDPANAHVWASLAAAQMGQGKLVETRESLTASWSLAPNNLQLASLRLSLLGDLMTGGEEDSLTPRASEIESARLDFETIRLHQPDEIDLLLEDYPALAEIVTPAS